MKAVHRSRSKLFAPAALFAALAVIVAAGFMSAPGVANAADSLLSQGKVTTASSTENAGTPAANATDGNTGTRWSSAFADPQWLQVDLGANANITQVALNWEAAYAKTFTIQTSPTGTGNWTDITPVTSGQAGVQTLTVSGSGRFVRMNGLTRATPYGYSLFEFQVYGAFGPTAPAGCGTTNVALNQPASASSYENQGANPASAAYDGNAGTRWSSVFADPQWIQVDLGTTQSVCKVVLNWEAAYAKTFTIQTSPTGTGSWTDITPVTNGQAGVQTLNVSGSGRFIRMNGLTRATGYGYSLWEFGVYAGTGGGTTTSSSSSTTTTTTTTTTPPNTGVCPTQSDTPNFGPNVHIYDPSMSNAAIQAQLDSDFNAQKDTVTAQFADTRIAELYKPGTYSVHDNVGFYNSVAGLGQNPDDVTINGDVTVDAFNSEDAGNATQNFWRSAENLAINPSSGTDRWGVAQAAPFRRIDVHGNLDLYPASYGWSSGGYISDTKVSGQVASASQQQWYSKDSNFGSWTGSNWNMVFSGTVGAPAQSFSTGSGNHFTTLDTTPASRDVPYLYITADGKYHVFEPSLRTNARGASWANGSTPGTSVPMSQFYVVKAGDTATTMNAALANGCNLFFTPGIYHLNQTLNVTKANTVILGIGYPTLIPDGGVNAMSVADVDGVRLKGLLFDAGTTNSNSLLTVGAPGSAGNHAANPTTIQDVFFRIGGQVAGKATNSLIVNSNNVIIDHIWAWRADHGAGVGWTSNTADQGVVVNGNNVLATGLFVEHYQKYNVTWNGQNGEVIFYQNENPYDPPNQAAWKNGSLNGYAAFKVADNVTSFAGYGMGAYVVFTADHSITNYHEFEVPNTAGVKLTDLAVVSLGGQGIVTHVVNDTGAQADSTTNNVYVLSYP
jgi:hypothetical protein